ncbi:MAG: hypothetical protein IKB01_07675, partial [Lachnospiraceae bacterium]|nr:hypothetical protein [Lachnospiraceae bacterium]
MKLHMNPGTGWCSMDLVFFFCSAAGVLAFITGYCTIFGAFLEERIPEERGKRVLPYLVYFVGYSILYEVWPRHETWIDLLLGSIVSIVIFLLYGAELVKAMEGTALAVSIALLADAMLVLVVSIVQFFHISEELIPFLLLIKETMGVGILFLILTMIFSVFFNRPVPRSELATGLYRAGANMMPILCI